MHCKLLTWILALATLSLVPGHEVGGSEQHSIIFATYAEREAELHNTLLMVRSIRTFAHSYQQAPIWVYLPSELLEQETALAKELSALKVEVKISATPADANWFYYAGKVFAAAMAEVEAEEKTAVLAWLDEDTIILQEPEEFILPAGKSLGYRPVMHKNISPLFSEPLDDFWNRAYDKMAVNEFSLFPMITPAFGDSVRAYFNAGCLIVRPERRLLREWVGYFTMLYQDTVLAEMCKQELKQRIFIHQVALVGALLNNVRREEMLEFSEHINFPFFFKEMFGSDQAFEDITGVVTLRHESYFRNPSPDWQERLQGPADKVDWIKKNLAGKKGK